MIAKNSVIEFFPTIQEGPHKVLLANYRSMGVAQYGGLEGPKTSFWVEAFTQTPTSKFGVTHNILLKIKKPFRMDSSRNMADISQNARIAVLVTNSKYESYEQSLEGSLI